MKDPLEEAGSGVARRGAGISLLILLLGLVALAILRPSTIDTLAIIVGIIALIMAHEFGHYWAAKRAGMKVTEFFLGFGPRLWSITRGETEYGVKALPAGGYVRIVGMNNLEDVEPDDESRTYRRGTFRRRITVVLAGVTVNFILAYFLIYVALLGQGVPNRIDTSVRHVLSSTPAAAAGFQDGDHIVSVDGRALDYNRNLADALRDRAGKPTTMVVDRQGGLQTITVTPKQRSNTDKSGIIGVEISQSIKSYTSYSPLAAAPKTFATMGTMTKDTAVGIGRLFSPAGIQRYSDNFTNAPKPGSTAEQERPRSIVGIVDVGGQIVNGNWWNLLLLLGAINLIVGLLNVIPLLPFDGGHAAVAVYEQIASKIRHREVRVDFRRLIPVTVVVLAVFLTLGLSTMFLDIRQIFTGS